MRPGSGRNGGSDLAAGIASAVAFVGLVFLIQMHVILALLLAGGVYAGTWMLTRPSAPALAPVVSEADLIRKIDALGQAIPNPQVRAKILEIRNQAGRVLLFIEQHPDKGDSWREILRE